MTNNESKRFPLQILHGMGFLTIVSTTSFLTIVIVEHCFDSLWNRTISIWVRHQQDLHHILKKVPDYKFAKHGLEQFQFYNIVSCLLRWFVSTIERELKSCRRGVLYPSISVMPNEYNSGEFPLLYWIVLPFYGIHMICQVYSGFAWNFTEQFEGVAELSLSPGWCRTSCLFDLPTNECKSCNVVLYQNLFSLESSARNDLF